jgi:hypothetical protein
MNRTFIQILEGPTLDRAQQVALVENEEATRVVKEALAAWLAKGRFVQRPPRHRRDWYAELGATLQEWCERKGISYAALTTRMRRGQSFEEAVQKLQARK